MFDTDIRAEYMHESVIAGFFIFDTDGSVLITHPTDDASGMGVWSIPKGRVESNESDLEAAYREVIEETALDLKAINGDVKEIDKVKYRSYMGSMKVCQFYSFRAKEQIHGNYKIFCKSMYNGKPENDDNRWVSIEEASQLLAPYQKDILSKLI